MILERPLYIGEQKCFIETVIEISYDYDRNRIRLQ